MKKCALSGCERQALADPQAQGCCILHAPWDGKDLSAFQAAIDEIIQNAPANNNICDFSGCYFPKDYDCKDLEKALKFNCQFIRVHFYNEVRFGQVEFSWDANFSLAKFHSNAYFW
ncbi:MAG: hypothetical protein K6T71_01890, partial [Candidatus Bipolaricaulota bacterium]|nr:hypothetical protein [Candidatus Bipolaricaulota bacterium]